jgi:hypothetical protein
MTSMLTGTAALVTGASSGIGAATATLLAEHGASVALAARRRDRLEAVAAEIEKAGGSALVVEADITDRTQAEAAVQQTVQRFGRLDTLVNNAGLMLLGPVVGADPEDWDRMIALHEAADEGGADVHAYLSGLQEADDRIDIVRNIWIDQLSDTERLLDAFEHARPAKGGRRAIGAATTAHAPAVSRYRPTNVADKSHRPSHSRSRGSGADPGRSAHAAA